MALDKPITGIRWSYGHLDEPPAGPDKSVISWTYWPLPMPVLYQKEIRRLSADGERF